MLLSRPSFRFLVSVLTVEMLLFGMCSESDPIFDMKVSQSLSTNSSEKNMDVSSSCNCRSECVTCDGCIAYWTYPQSYRWRCYLFLYGPTHYLINATKVGGVCGVRKYPGSNLEADGLYYFIPTKISLNFTSAREDCKVAHGYRLAVLKMIISLHAVVKKYSLGYPYTVVDLKWDINVTFGDGTFFRDSEVSKLGQNLLVFDSTLSTTRNYKVFVLLNGAFTTQYSEKNHYELCQGDPLRTIL